MPDNNSHSQRLSKRWRNAERWIVGLTDLAGFPVDPQIKSSVIALKAHGFETTASCEGHLDRGEAAPWIDVGVFLLPRTKSGRLRRLDVQDRARIQWKKIRNLRAQQRMLELLEAFYRNHHAPLPTRLMIRPVGMFGAFTLTNQGIDIQELLPRSERRSQLVAFQREFKRFTECLRDRL